MNDEKLLYSSFSSRIIENLSDKKKEDIIHKNIIKYIDRNNEILYSGYPLDRLIFDDTDTGNDKKFIYEITNVLPNEVTKVIKLCKDIKSNYIILNKPFNILMCTIISVLTIENNKKENKNRYEKLIKNIILYLGLAYYSSLHFKYFRFPPNRDAMEYTINNLNHKFKLKKMGTMLLVIMDIMLVCYESQKEELLTGDDIAIINYCRNTNSRLNNFIQKLKDEYMKVLESKKYLPTESDTMGQKSDDDNPNYKETTNVSLQISRITSIAVNSFYTNPINEKFLETSCNFMKVSTSTLRIAIEDIKKSNENKNIEILIRSILQIYLTDENNSLESIGSSKFIGYCIQIYTKSNTLSNEINKIKKILDIILTQYCNKYSNTEREATKLSYRKAFYIYIVLIIQNSYMYGS